MMKRILLLIYVAASSLIILLHTQTIPFILLIVMTVVITIIYYNREKTQKALMSNLVQENDTTTLQLKAASENSESSFLYDAFLGIQKSIIKNEIDKSIKPTAVRMALPLFNETRYVNIDDIVRCEAENSYTKFFLSNREEILVSKILKKFSDFLTSQWFVRTHQSHLINTNFIKSWMREDGGYLLLVDGSKIPVSRANRDKVKEKLTED